MKLYDQSCCLKTQDETKVVDSLGVVGGERITSNRMWCSAEATSDPVGCRRLHSIMTLGVYPM